MKRSHCLLLVLLICFCHPVWGARHYTTTRLQAMASLLPLSGVDTLSAGTYTHFSYQSHPLIVRVNVWNEVEHIGLRLFEEDTKTSTFFFIYDFLERYLLEWNLVKGTDEEIRLGFDNVICETGSFADALRLDGTEKFNMVYQPFSGYQVSWSKEDKELLALTFEADYQLISGCNLIELEKNYLKNMTRFRLDTCHSSYKKEDISFPENDTFYIKKGTSFFIENIRNDLYFQKDEKQEWKLINNPQKPYQSIANLFLAKGASEGYQLSVTLDMYGYKEAKDTIRLKDWLGLCEQEGCTSFFGMKNKTESTYMGTVFMVNEACGYIHMLSVTVPVHDIGKQEGFVEGRLFVYIPTRSLRNNLLMNITDYKTIKDEN
ncbi:MAG TPA: hypothetical protein H9818_00985 [Candidatus Phocaeicola gallistercoris]|nr:hypothetical protein [Candidatus Phocaeicola gallistercoris]